MHPQALYGVALFPDLSGAPLSNRFRTLKARQQLSETRTGMLIVTLKLPYCCLRNHFIDFDRGVRDLIVLWGAVKFCDGRA